MRALPELQSRFCDAVLLGAEAEEGLLECLMEPGDAGRQGIAIYRRSILGNLIGALLATYPVLARIVGLPFFREMARAYCLAQPSRSGDLNEYGETLPDFIAAWPHGRELGYLADVARLEWSVQTVYYAPDAAADLSALASCPPEDYGALRFAPNPAMARLDSPWPLADIWRVNGEGYEGDMAVDFAVGARLIVLRRDGLVHVESLTDGEAAFLDAFAGRAALAEAAASALAADAAFDLGAGLARFIGNGAILRATRAILAAQDTGGQP